MEGFYKFLTLIGSSHMNLLIILLMMKVTVVCIEHILLKVLSFYWYFIFTKILLRRYYYHYLKTEAEREVFCQIPHTGWGGIVRITVKIML